MHIVIIGGSGFIGRLLIEQLLARGESVTIVSRTAKAIAGARSVTTLDSIADTQAVDAVINLAGAPIDARWTSQYKATLINSRVNTTTAMVQWLQQRPKPPQVLINASAIGWYGVGAPTDCDEHTPSQGGFTHQLCERWETTAQKAAAHVGRICIARLGVVLGHGGALTRMLPAFRLGLGGKLGDGQQPFAWIHHHDVCQAMVWLLDTENASGVYNLTAPNPVTNAVFTRALGKALRRPTRCTMPAMVVQLLFGEMGGTLLLQGARVLPKRLLDAGFAFSFADIDKALVELVGNGNQ